MNWQQDICVLSAHFKTAFVASVCVNLCVWTVSDSQCGSYHSKTPADMSEVYAYYCIHWNDWCDSCKNSI